MSVPVTSSPALEKGNPMSRDPTFQSATTFLDGSQRKGESKEETIIDSLLTPLLAIGTIGVVLTVSVIFGAIGWSGDFGDTSDEAIKKLKRGVDFATWSFYFFACGTAPILEIAILYAIPPVKKVIVGRQNVLTRANKTALRRIVENLIVCAVIAMLVAAMGLQVVGALIGLVSIYILFGGPLKFYFTIVFLLGSFGWFWGILFVSALLDHKDNKYTWKQGWDWIFLGVEKRQGEGQELTPAEVV